MQSKADNINEYISELAEDRKQCITNLHAAILKNIPSGFEPCMNYGMIGYVIPHSIFPAGYHCDPKMPLPFINIASQKNHVAVYHMGIYGSPDLKAWFEKEYAKLNIGKLDMGGSCIRFKNIGKIPYELIGELASKITVDQYIEHYTKTIANTKKNKGTK